MRDADSLGKQLNNSSINKIEASSNLSCSTRHPFYKSLQDLFNSTDESITLTETRKKDIIYSKLQKQRSAIQKLQELMKGLKKEIRAKGSRRLVDIDNRRVDSGIKMFEGVEAFFKQASAMDVKRSSDLKSLFCKYSREEVQDILENFKNFCVPSFLRENNMYS